MQTLQVILTYLFTLTLLHTIFLSYQLQFIRNHAQEQNEHYCSSKRLTLVPRNQTVFNPKLNIVRIGGNKNLEVFHKTLC